MKIQRLIILLVCICLMTGNALAARSAGDADELLRILSTAKEDSLEIQCDRGLLDSLLRDNGRELHRINILAAIEDAEISYSSGGLLLYNDIRRFACPVLTANDENELSALFAACGTDEVGTFIVLCGDTLYASLRENDFNLLKQVEAAAGITERDLGYIDSLGELAYGDVQYNRSIRLLQTFGDVSAYVTERVLRGDRNIDLLCGEELYTALLTPAVASSSGFTPLGNIEAQAGIMDCTVMLPDNNCLIQISDIRLYPGYRLSLDLTGNGQHDAEPEDKALLAAAQEVLSACPHTDSVEVAAWLNDRLCEMTEYVVDPSTKADDCALGPLLYGQANCSGYTDAYYLLCSMAGLEVCYQPGDSKAPTSEEVGHVWNALKLNGDWYFTDVTWNDGSAGDRMTRTYFAIGKDLASRTHIWDNALSVGLSETTDPDVHGLKEYVINNDEELEAIERQIAQERPECFGILLSENMYSDFSAGEFLGNSYRSYRYIYPQDDENHMIFYDVEYR